MTPDGTHIWVATAMVQGGAVPQWAVGGYAVIVARGRSIESAVGAARDACTAQFSSVEIVGCRQVDLTDPDEDVGDAVREEAQRMTDAVPAIVATLHAWGPEHAE